MNHALSTPPLPAETPRNPGPRAPSQAAWDAMSDAERNAAVRALEDWQPDLETAPSDGDVQEAEKRAEQERERAEGAERRAEEAERRVAELQATIDRLRGA